MPLILPATKHVLKTLMGSIIPIPRPLYLCVIVMCLWLKKYLRILSEVSSNTDTPQIDTIIFISFNSIFSISNSKNEAFEWKQLRV